MFRVKKSNHSKKIVKQLKREYKEDLEKSGSGPRHEFKSGGMAENVVEPIPVSVATPIYTLNVKHFIMVTNCTI